MKKVYMIVYLNENMMTTHFDNRGFESYREATQTLLDEEHEVYSQPDPHTDDQEDVMQTIFEHKDEYGQWFAKIHELEMQ